jgi:hypothetical protein
MQAFIYTLLLGTISHHLNGESEPRDLVLVTARTPQMAIPGGSWIWGYAAEDGVAHQFKGTPNIHLPRPLLRVGFLAKDLLLRERERRDVELIDPSFHRATEERLKTIYVVALTKESAAAKVHHLGWRTPDRGTDSWRELADLQKESARA